MTDIIKLGDTVIIYGTFLVNDIPTNPVSLRLEIEDPEGTITEYVWNTDLEIVRTTVGAFRFNLTVTQSGEWKSRWFGNGSLDAFESDSTNVANIVVVLSLNNESPSTPVAFVSFRIWDGEGNVVNTGIDPLRTDSFGELAVSLPYGSYRIAPIKLNWIFDVTYVDITAESVSINLVGRPILTRWLQWEDLETVTDTETVDKLFTDANTSTRDMKMVEDVLQQAETIAEVSMLRSWSQSQIAAMAKADPGLRSQAAWMAMEFATERRHEFISAEGHGRYWAQYERAVSYFDKLSKSQTHSRGEASAGKGSNSGGAVRPRLQANQARRVFSDEPDGTGHGGF
jgi:hypothetical protein